MSHTFTFVVAGDPAQITGGYLYDAKVVAALRQQDWKIDVVGLEGSFPEPDASAARSLEETLAAQPDGSRVVIDNLAMGGLPEIVARHTERLDLTALVHHPLADETGLDEAQRTRFLVSESRALASVRRVIATSPFTARRLADFGVPAERIAVVEPGVDPAPLAATVEQPSTGRQRLLCIATITPRKGHDILIDALAQLTDFDWQCDCIGGLDRAPKHADTVASMICERNLEHRIRLLGERGPDTLGAAYHDADLFVLPSRYEGYGMVITEALSHGVPIITTTGGALAYTLPRDAGIGVPPGDSVALADALRSWFEDEGLRDRLRQGARQARSSLETWEGVASAFAKALGSAHPDNRGAP